MVQVIHDLDLIRTELFCISVGIVLGVECLADHILCLMSVAPYVCDVYGRTYQAMQLMEHGELDYIMVRLGWNGHSGIWEETCL